MSEREVQAIRTRAAILRTSNARAVRLRGEGARDTARWVMPSRMHLRDAQARQTLFLDEEGRPIADVLVCADDEAYLLIVDGVDPIAHLTEHAIGDVAIDDLMIDHAIFEVHGPWAWELVAEVLGTDFVALPYLNFFRIDEGWCVRAGRTGEFGYQLIVRASERDRLLDRFVTAGAAFDLVEVTEGALSSCALENWFFDAAHVPAGATPIELQLQWRLANDRDYLGRAAIEARRQIVTSSQVCLLSAHELAKGDRVMLGDRDIGEIVRAERSTVRGEWIAAALVERALAHGGIDRFRVNDRPVRTAAPPLIDNRSLYVDPRRHAYRTRDEITFGSLVRKGGAAMGAE